MTFLDELEDEPATEVVAAPIVPAKTAMERLQEVQNEILVENLRIIEDVTHFRDINPPHLDKDGNIVEPTIPEAWVAQLGPEEAEKRMRVAKASWMSAKEAPVALAIAKSVVVGITKALATAQTGPKVLNVAVVQMTAPLPAFKVRDMTKELENK